MKRMILAVACLIISGVSAAQTFSNASLNGKYAIQFVTPDYVTWFKTFSCPTNSTVTYTAMGSTTTMNGVLGVGSFDGAGHFAATVTNFGKVDPSGSANTLSVTWNSACRVTSVNNGHVVYIATSTGTASGTYSVKSTGAGTLTLTGQNGPPLAFQLAALDSAGISTTVLVTTTQTNGKSIGAGIAVHE